ncbi:MAG: VWA domain-containing protein [Pseudomonadota bacterium]
MIDTFHFLRPWWFVALLALPLLDRALRHGAMLSNAWARIVDPHLLPYLLTERADAAGGRAWVLRWLPLLAFTLVTVALAGPAWRELPQPVLRDQSSLVVAFDLSQSMNATDLTPSRLERARLKVIDLLEQREDGQTALISFAGLPFVVSPLTSDAATIQSLVPVLEPDIMPAGGSRADRALALAADLISGGGDGRGSVLLVTDSAEGRDVAMAEKLREQGVVTSVLGVGTREGAPVRVSDGGLLKDADGRIVHTRLDEERLRALARAGGGRYTRISIDDDDLERLGEALAAAGDLETEDAMSTDIWREEGPWLLLPLLPLAAMVFRRGALAVVLASGLVIGVPRPAAAFEWSSLWQRDDQRGVRLLRDEERYADAAELLDDPEWRAAALYRDEQFGDSAELLSDYGTVRAAYNRGTALARQGDYRSAIEVYRGLLERDPEHEDAKHNLEVLLDELERQQQEQEGEGEGDQQDQQNGEQSADSQGAQGSEGSGQDPSGGDSRGAGSGGDDDEQLADQERQPGEMSREEIEAEAERRAQQSLPEDDGEGEPQEQRMARLGEPSDATSEEREQQAAVEQWLRRIPDDPGGLLRRKFLYELQRRREQGEMSEEDPW